MKQDTPDGGLVEVTGTVDADAISESTVMADPSEDTVIAVSIVLPVQDETALEAFVDSVSDPDNPNFRNYCTPDEFAAWFGPTDDLFDDVADYVEDEGMTVTNSDTDSNVVMNVTGTIRQIRKAFHVRIRQYHHNALNRDFFSAEKEPRLPKRIAGEVRAIIGLDNFARPTNSLTTSRRAMKPSNFGSIGRVSRSPVIISHLSLLQMSNAPSRVSRGLKRGSNWFGDMSNIAAGSLLSETASLNRLTPLLVSMDDDGDGRASNSVVGGNSPVLGGFTPMNIKSIYGLGGLAYTGAGQTIGLIEFDNFDPNSIAAFCSGTNLQIPAGNVATQPSQIQTTFIDGYTGLQDNLPSDQQECELDIEMALGFAPGANVQVFEAPPQPVNAVNAVVQTAAITSFIKEYVDTLSTIANHWPAVKQVSTSWSLNEASFLLRTPQNGRTMSITYLAGIDLIALQMAAQGQTLLVGAGDSGSYNYNPKVSPRCPATSPYVTAVGGTYLTATSSDGYVRETQWDEDSSHAGGGGYSALEKQPSYQASVLPGQTYRGVPDVSLNAVSYGVYTIAPNGLPGWMVLDGTSAAAPLWAAFVSLVNQKNQTAGAASVGFINPILYKLGARMPSVFNDITINTTSSTNPNRVPSINAMPGFDLSTGWGSINGMNLFNNL